jgi:PQQ-dependent catabolism-associated beta-propeller protein
MTRGTFLQIGVAALAGPGWRVRRAPPAAIGIIIPASGSQRAADAHDGAALAVLDADRTARLLRRPMHARLVLPAPADLEQAIIALRADEVGAVVVYADADIGSPIRRICLEHKMVALLASPSLGDADADCASLVFQTDPGIAAYARALVQHFGAAGKHRWRIVASHGAETAARMRELVEREGAQVAGADAGWADVVCFAGEHGLATSAGGRAVWPVAWHERRSAFGAEQLNERFRRRYGRGMTAAAWTTWMAVKALTESIFKTGVTDAAAVSRHLRSPRTAFDGHKGLPLSFDGTTGRLRQPVYLLGDEPAGAREVSEFPARGERRGTAARELLAVPRAPSGCRSAALTLGLCALAVTGGVAQTPRALVSNEVARTISVIDVTHDRVVATIPVPGRPRGLAFAPDGRTAFVALSDTARASTSDADAIAAIDLERRVVAYRLAAGTDPEAFAITPDGRWIYASNEDAGTASAIDRETRQVVATLAVGIEPEGVAVSPDGRWVYVTAETSNTVSVIDTRTRQVVASFLVDVRPRAAAFAPDSAIAYVTAEIGGTVTVVDTRTHQPIASITISDADAKPVGVAFSPDGAWAYVSNGRANSIAVIDARRHTLVTTIPVGSRPWGIAVTPDGRKIYTANGVSGDVTIVDAEHRTVLGTIATGAGAWGVVVSPR